MARCFPMMLLLVLAVGCGETWGRPGGVEVPLHRDVLGLNPVGPACALEKPEWERRCTREHYKNKEICPEGCPLSEPEKGSKDR